MLSEANTKLAHQWILFFNEHNLASLLDLYNNDAQHYSPKLKIRKPETGGLIKGKNSLQSWWQDAFERLPTLQYELINTVADEQSVFMEYIRHVEGEEDLRVAELLEISKGLILFSRVYHG